MAVDIEDIQTIESSPSDEIPPKRGRGRPKGSTGKSGNISHTAQYVLVFSAVFSGLSVIVAYQTQNPSILMKDNEAKAIAKPLANIFSKTTLARYYGKYLAESNDYLALGMALYTYGSRVWDDSIRGGFVRARSARSQEGGRSHGYESAGYASTATGDESDNGVGANPFVSPNVVNLTPNRGD